MRRRVVIAIAGVAAVAVVLFAVPLAIVLQRNYRNEALLRLQRDTIAATSGIDLGAPATDPIELPPSKDVLALYDPAGRRIAGRGPAQADSLVSSALHSESPSDDARSGRLVAAVPILVRERVEGVLRAERSDAAFARRTRDAWLALAGLSTALVAFSLVAASFLGRRLARPVERLAAAARRLGEGDFGARAPRSGVPEADEVAAALDHTARRLDDLVARERSFTADASHQLRTPLAALRLELEAIELRGDPSPELQRVLAQVDRLQATIETLLAIARDADRPAAECDVLALIDDQADRWRGPLAAEARPLRIAQRAETRTARAAPGVVTEILGVLLENAHDHGDGTVTVALRATDGWVAVDVSDEGVGFEDPDQAFRRRSGTRDGHGIGLALAQTLAHAEGGRLSITRARPPIVTLWLPRADRAPDASDAAPAGPSAVVGTA